jgi:rhodanese-related sulfurtransferase
VIDAETLRARIEEGDVPGLLDVRQPFEQRAGRLPGAVSIPLGQLVRPVARSTQALRMSRIGVSI